MQQHMRQTGNEPSGMAVEEAIAGRKCYRAFLPDPVPVELIERDLEMGSWLDYGMFLQNIMIAARAFGLETCPQQAFAKFHSIIQKRLAIPGEQMIVCGMSLGYADYDATVNQLTTERMPVSEFATFIDRLEAD